MIKPPYPLILPDLPGFPQSTTVTPEAVGATAVGAAASNAAPGVAELLRENAILKDKIKELEKKIKHTKDPVTALRRH